MTDAGNAPSPDSPKSVIHVRSYTWSTRAAIFQLAFCGMLLIGFIEWMSTDIHAVAETAPEISLWLNPVLHSISQPIGSVIAIVGAYLLLKRRKIGLYVSAASVPVLLTNTSWMGFIGVAIFPLFNYRLLALTELDFYFILVVIYGVCTATIAALLAVVWRVTKW